MTIRLTNPMHAIEVDPPRAPTTYHIVFVGNQAVALADTAEEAQQAKRAFEQVLAPRFTRDEAIAIVKANRGVNAVLTVVPMTNARREFIAGLRAALVALADAGVFVDGRNMTDKLDAAGIR